MSIFIAGPVRPSYLVIKSQVYLKCPLQIRRFFSITRMYVHVRWNVREAIRVYTRKCAANIVEKYEPSLVVG